MIVLTMILSDDLTDLFPEQHSADLRLNLERRGVNVERGGPCTKACWAPIPTLTDRQNL